MLASDMFGLALRYDPTRHQVKVTAELSRGARGVGGGTRYKTPRRVATVALWLPPA
jgi:hypothetical protein